MRKEALPTATVSRVLDAATRLFSRYGFKKTSMEEVAREGEVAKATLYAHYPHKEALFQAVSEKVASDMIAASKAAAAGAGDPAGAVAASLSAKFERMFEVVHGSEHARELLESSNRLSGAVLVGYHDAYVRELSGLLAEVVPRREAKKLAELLDACAEGIAATARSTKDVRDKIELLCGRVLAPEPKKARAR